MSNAISKKDKKYVDMLRVLYSDTAEFKEELVRAKSAFDLFQTLIVAGVLKSTDISVLFQTIELTGLRFLKEIIEKYRKYPDKVEITLFSAYRQHVVAWGKNVLCEVLQNVRQRYEIPVNISTNPWKVITYLENKDIISEDKWSSFLMNVKSSDNEEASTSKKQKLNEGKSGLSKQPKRQRIDKDSVIREYFLEEQKKFLKEKNYYCPPTYIDDTIDIDGLFTDLELVKRDGRGKRVDAVSASLEEILNLISSKDSCKVLIEGEGGMGKTTLLRYISYRWANKKDNTFLREIVFLINIRDIKPNEDVINVISRIHVENFKRRKKMEITSAELGSFITNHDNEIVLLLDGLDELNSEATRPINIFENQNFSKVLLTSRPGNISDFANKCNVYVKVLGFNSNSIKQFIDNFFIRDPDSGKSLRTYLYKYEKDDDDDNYSQLYDLCRSPMLLLSICTIWKEKKCLPQNLASLFEELFYCILNQYNKKNHVRKLSNFAKIRQYKKYEKYEKCFSILGKCMYESLKENKLSIEFDDLSKYNSNEDENCFALAIGILYKELPKGAQDFSDVYTAPHKLIAESLAGLYICWQCQKCASFLSEEWDTISTNKYLHMTRIFAISFLGAHADKLLQHWITNDAMDYRSLMKYLMSLEIEQQPTVVQNLDTCISEKDLAIRQQFPSICNSLRMFVLHCNPDIKINNNYSLIQHVREVLLLEKKLGSSVFTKSVDGWINAKSSVENPVHKLLSHLMFAAKDQRCITATKAFLFGSDTFFENISTDFGNLNLVYDDKLEFNFNNNYIKSRFLIVHLLNFVPKNLYLNLDNCSLSGTFINSVFSKCYSNLVILDLSRNNLTDIEGFLNNVPNLFSLKMEECSLSGTELAKMVRSLNMSTVPLEIFELKDNIFDDIEGTLLSTLLVNAPELDILDVTNCELSSVVINDMVSDLKKNHRSLALTEFLISGNDLNDIDGHTLSDLLSIAPNLKELNLNSCNLVGTIVNNMFENCPLHNKLHRLDVDNNNLSDINKLSLVQIRRKCPNLVYLNMGSCQLKETVVRDMMNEYRDTSDVSWEWSRLDLQCNDLHDIGDATIYALLKVKALFDLFDCISTVDQLDAVVDKCVKENIVLECTQLSNRRISQLRCISGAMLGNVLKIAPKLKCLTLSSCSLSGDSIKEMFSNCNILELEELYLANNHLHNMEGETLIDLFTKAPKLCVLDMTGCQLSSIAVSEMISYFKENDKKLMLEEIDIDIDRNVLSELLSVAPNLRSRAEYE
ncbi:NLR family CARD domain-containing protein 4-like [Anneissia japonica]|uniref:NLR family CARD domain-containing protein 4-like n=1 Tax=Anneissia japonica TaxID=1529436 RepID=UPI0014258727|nr:NLR family CARD domain-containing protein 4-like [Anneissia japonica]